MGSLNNTGFVCVVMLLLVLGLILATYFLVQSNRRAMAAKLWLAIFVTGFSYLVGDLLGGFFILKGINAETEPHPILHHLPRPNSTGHAYVPPDIDHFQEINRHGLRGDNFEFSHPGGETRRILILGDSFALGKGVEDDQTPARLLENKLTERGHDVEVLNGGVNSHSPVLSHLLLQQHLAGLEVDLILYFFDMSDLRQEQSYRNIATFGPDGSVQAVPGVADTSGLTNKIRDHIFQRHYFTTRLILWIKSSRLKKNGALSVSDIVETPSFALLAHTIDRESTIDIAGGSHTTEGSAWEGVRDSIRGIRDEAKKRNAKLVIVTYPWGHQVGNDDTWHPGKLRFVPSEATIDDRSREEITKIAKELELPLLDAFDTFRDPTIDVSELYFSHDLHWTIDGHLRMAEFLTPRVEELLNQ